MELHAEFKHQQPHHRLIFLPCRAHLCATCLLQLQKNVVGRRKEFFNKRFDNIQRDVLEKNSSTEFCKVTAFDIRSNSAHATLFGILAPLTILHDGRLLHFISLPEHPLPQRPLPPQILHDLRYHHPRLRRRVTDSARQRRVGNLFRLLSKVFMPFGHFHTCCTRKLTSLRSSRDKFLGNSILFNLPPALFFVACFIVLTCWTEIHSRCVEMTGSNTASSFADKCLSKPVM